MERSSTSARWTPQITLRIEQGRARVQEREIGVKRQREKVQKERRKQAQRALVGRDERTEIQKQKKGWSKRVCGMGGEGGGKVKVQILFKFT